MISTKLYLDTRNVSKGAEAPIKILLVARRKSTTYPTGIRVMPSQWDAATSTVINHPEEFAINTLLTSIKSRWDVAVLKLIESGDISKPKNVVELKKAILRSIDPDLVKADKKGNFYDRYVKYMNSRLTEGNKTTYARTLKKLEQFDAKLRQRNFEDIDKDYLQRFDEFCINTRCAGNGRSFHFRNIRAVFNDAIDDELTVAYPFRKFKIKSQPTRKRSLSAQQLRQLMSYPCEEYQEQYRDMFMLMFYLCGVNAVDLLNAPKNAIVNGRFEYVRAKTHKPYSILVYPEAQAIIDKYKGQKHLLCIMDNCTSYLDYLRRMDAGLKSIGPMTRVGRGGKKVREPLFPQLSQYWCRHTWATTAAELDIPKETIAAGLGHSGNTVTDIYINFNERKVDEANRRIIDFVLYGKR